MQFQKRINGLISIFRRLIRNTGCFAPAERIRMNLFLIYLGI